MGARKTQEKFVKEVYDLVGDEYDVLSTYNKSDENVLFRHRSEVCDYHEFPMTPHAFLKKGRRCQKCAVINNSSKLTKSHEVFIEEVKNLVGDEYTVLGKYMNARTHIKMKHNICGHEWDIQPDKFLNGGRRCRKCFGKNKKTTEQFKLEVYDLVKDEYEVFGEYTNYRTDTLFKHVECGTVFPT